MKLNISALGHTRKLEFSSYVHLPSINKIFPYHQAQVILCNEGDFYIFEPKLYISVLEHARMLILSNYVLLASINTFTKYCEA